MIMSVSLKKVAKGTIIVFIGLIVGMLLAFIGRVIVIRYITQSEYGTFCIALALLNIFVIISTLGLQEGVPRQIAYFRGKNKGRKDYGVVISSLQIALVTAVLFSSLLFFASDFISIKFFHNPELSLPLKIFSAALPFLALINILTAIFRGYGKIDVKVYFQDILRNALFPLFLVVVILLGLSFFAVLYAHVVSIVITCIVFAIYTMKKTPLLKAEKDIDPDPMRKDLLFFSLPLLVAFMLNLIMIWTDTLMLGYFKTSDIVGLYNGALPLARLIPIALASMVFIYTPIIAQLYSQNLIEEIKRNYTVLTKWIFVSTLPLFLIFFLFPEIVLDFFFGPQYVQADIALRILTFGFFIHTLLGPNAATLIAMGRTRLLMWTSLAGAVLNVVLNISLIPLMDISGAAIASGSALALVYLILSIRLYQLSEVHPFTKNYLKSILTSIVLMSVIYIIAKKILEITFWMLPILLILFIVAYAFSLLLTKSFDEEDIMMFLEIEKNTGIDAPRIKGILKRFL